ncbi:MAG: class I SAM-dependent DNA methyltransferase [Anaerolineae bacterium]
MSDPYGAYARFYDLDMGGVDEDLFMIRQFAARSGSPILELACGTGRVLLPLAREGYDVTGVDISPAMLELAGQKIAVAGLGAQVDLVAQDMRYLDLGVQFNMVLIALSSFSHLLTMDEQLSTLERVYEHLNPGGLLVLDLFNPDLQRLLDFRGQVILDKVITDPASGRPVLKFRTETVDLAQQVIDVTYIVDEVNEQGHVQRTLFPFLMRYLFRHELELLLRYAGFELEAIYGSYALDEFGEDSENMVAVARRPS